MKRRLATVLGVFVLVFGLTTPAFAHEADYHASARNVTGPPNSDLCTTVADRAGLLAKGCFVPSGDKFWVRDMRVDGHHADLGGEALESDRGRRSFRCHDYRGKKSGWTVCDGWASQIEENSWIWLIITIYEGNRRIATGGELFVSTG